MTRIKMQFIQVGNHEISWIGACPWTSDICFGEEDGFLILLREAIGIGERIVLEKKFTTDAINSVAFAGDLIAVSSRNEVTVAQRLDGASYFVQTLQHGFVGGAHGVVASRSGAFLAPIGDQGFLMLKPDPINGLTVQVGSLPGFPFNFTKLIRLGEEPLQETFAAAARHDGIVAFSVADDMTSKPIVHHQLEGHDIVDLCPLNDSRYPRALACVSRDRVIFLFRDVLENAAPATLKYTGFSGTAYSLLSARGHLVLLTDRELVTMPNIAALVLDGTSLPNSLDGSTTSLHAAEAFLYRDQTIFLIVENSTVVEIQLDDLVRNALRMDSEVTAVANGNGHVYPGEISDWNAIPGTFTLIPVASGWISDFPLQMITV